MRRHHTYYNETDTTTAFMQTDRQQTMEAIVQYLKSLPDNEDSISRIADAVGRSASHCGRVVNHYRRTFHSWKVQNNNVIMVGLNSDLVAKPWKA